MVPKLANGELLWITDDKKLYIGDGVLASSVLVPVTGFNAENAQDAAASLFTTTPTHSGISFAYDDFAGTLTATVNLSDYTGEIKASAFKGTFVADDSSILVDGVAGVLKGTLVGSLTGNVTGNVTGNLSGNVTGNLSGNVTGNTTGYHTGDVTGSVFADNSSLLVDAVDGIFFGTLDTGDTMINTDSLTGNNFNLGTTTAPLNLNLNLNNNLQLRQVVDPVNGKFITFSQSRGSLTSPLAVTAGDELGGFLMRAFTSVSNSAIAGYIQFTIDSTSTIPASSASVKSKVFIGTSSDSTTLTANALSVNSDGVATSNAFVASKYTQLAVYANDAARTSAIATPAKGMMVFMTAGTSPAVTNKAVVYDGSAWVALH
jgi:hypothetical protein